jgi:hypothetical protein
MRRLALVSSRQRQVAAHHAHHLATGQ